MNIQSESLSIDKKIKKFSSEFKNTTEIIDYATTLDNRILIFSGFNPLLHPEILDICSYAKEKDFITGLASAIPINEYDIPDSLGCDVDWIIMPDFSMENMKNKSKSAVFRKLNKILKVREIIRDEDISFHLYSGVNHFNADEDFSILSKYVDPDIMTFILYYAECQEDCHLNNIFLSETDLISFMNKNNGLRLPNGLRPAIMYSDDPVFSSLKFNACQNI